jgi:dTDP-glucose 4,6-dehydratase
MKTYLVTGGAGFIGSNFIKYILGKYGSDVKIIILDALTYAGNLLTLKGDIEQPNVVFVKGDIGDRELVDSLLAEYDPDYVVNFAAESHVDRSITNPRLFLETNILGTQNLLDCARRDWATGKDAAGCPVYKERLFLQISTDEVYGSLPRTPGESRPLELKPEVARVAEGRTDLRTFGDGFFTELTPLAPRSPYSASKTSADMLVQAYHETYGLPVAITRCSNNYGPYQFPEKLIPLVIKNILEGRKLPVYGRGENVRDWLYVDDHCKAIDMVLRNGRVGEVYNIGGFNEQDNITIVRSIIAIMRRLLEENASYRELLQIPLEEVDERLITYVADRPGHDMRYAIDPEKIVSELGWYPETSFPVGIEKTVRWYLDNPGWTEGVTSGSYLRYYEEMYGDKL